MGGNLIPFPVAPLPAPADAVRSPLVPSLPPPGGALRPLMPPPLRPTMPNPRRPPTTRPPRPRPPRPTRPEPRRQPRPAYAAPQVDRPAVAIVPPVRQNSYRQHVVDCPLCGRRSEIGRFDGAPYGMQMFVVDIGGAVTPGKVRQTPSGKIIDHANNRRGSISVRGAWDPQMAVSLEEQVSVLARQIADLADSGNLAEPGKDG